MTKLTKRILLTLAITGLLGAPLTGCGDMADDGSTPSEAGNNAGNNAANNSNNNSGETEAGSDFEEAIPSEQMLALSTGEPGGETSQGLSTAEQGLGGPAGQLREHTREVMAGINELVRDSHRGMRELIQNTDPVEITRDGETCYLWSADGERAHWKLLSCRKDRRARHYGYLLTGRPLDAEDVRENYLAVIGGKGWVHDRHEDRRRGRGRVGYDLDNLATLTGAPVAGKLGIGYRAVGQVRQLNVGLREVQGPELRQPYSALFRFKHIEERGSLFRYLTRHDFLTRDESDEIIHGQDGIDEHARASVAWSRRGAARAAFAICGGTLGERTCVHFHQCWSREGDVTFEESVQEDRQPPTWEPNSCAEVFDSPEQPPRDDEMMPPEEGDEIAIPEPSDDE